MSTRSTQKPAYLNTLDPRLRKVIIDAAAEHDISLEAVIAIYKSAYKSFKTLMQNADKHSWPVVLMPGLGYFKPHIPRRYKRYDKYYETPLKLRYKFKLLGSKPSAYHPQGIPDHLWE